MYLTHIPDSLDQFLGNEQLIKSLKEYTFDIPILFEGLRGCGKSTLAKIISKLFKAPDQNIYEINCFHTSDVKSIRDLVDSFYRSSIFGTNKVYILDEIHGLSLSRASQNELLIPLTKLPKNVLVIACTTTTEKVLNILLDRFVRYKVSPLSVKDSLILINRICEKENIKLSKPIQSLLIEKSEGIPRNILTGLYKVRNIKDENEASYLLDLNQIDEFDKDVLDLFKLLCSSAMDWTSIKKHLKFLLTKQNPEDIRIGLMNILSGKLMSDFVKDNELGFLNKMYDILKSGYGFPEKANLIHTILKIFLEKN